VAVRLTLTVALRAVAFGLPLAILAALALTRRFPLRAVLDAVVHLPLALPPVVVGWLLLLTFGVRGPIGAWLRDWVGVRLVFTSAGASLAFPLAVRAIRLSLEAIDPGLNQAARTLGAGAFDRFWSVTLPLAAPGVLVGALVAFAASLGEFGAVIVFASNVPGETQTLPLAIYTALQTPGGENIAARLSVVSIALAVAALLAADFAGRRLRRRIGR
jgi:molybdate transport system permease protein